MALTRGMGMEVCCTLGMLEKKQAVELKKAGLTAYNHNLDTSREYYPKIITTRTYDERLETLQHVRDAGINVCSGIQLLEFGPFVSPFFFFCFVQVNPLSLKFIGYTIYTLL